MLEWSPILSRLISVSIVYIYSFCSAIYSPLPSEAPMFLFPDLTRIEVLIFCALGKSSGAYIVFLSGSKIQQAETFLKFISFLRLQSFWLRFSTWVNEFMKTYGIWGFLFFMSVPFMPMRSAIYSVSITKTNHLYLVLAVAVGTVIRNSIVYWGIINITNI